MLSLAASAVDEVRGKVQGLNYDRGRGRGTDRARGTWNPSTQLIVKK